MRLLVPILTLLPTLSLAISRKAQRYASQAVSSPDNVLILNNESYDDLLAEKERDYSVSVVLTAMDAGFKVRLSLMIRRGEDQGARAKEGGKGGVDEVRRTDGSPLLLPCECMNGTI
jgi:hypothetical protein